MNSDHDRSNTPKEFKHVNTISNKFYEEHKLRLLDSLQKFVERKEGPYYPREFDSTTKIFIDTILFSPQKNKLAFFVIARNSNDKLLPKGDPNSYHYDANFFIAGVEKDSTYKIVWVDAFSITNYPSYDEASEDIREYYFNKFSNRKNIQDESRYKYNLDDIRFWDGPLWEEL